MEKNKYDEYLLDTESSVAQGSTNSKSSCFSLCCCKGDKEVDKTYYINKWRKYLVT
jgi:hypothetical protein